MSRPRGEVRLSEAEFKALPEYSCSLPTCPSVGRRWRRNTTAYLPGGPHEPHWVMGEAVPDPEPGWVGVRWSEIVHTCRCEGCGEPTRSGKPGGFCSLHAYFMMGSL